MMRKFRVRERYGVRNAYETSLTSLELIGEVLGNVEGGQVERHDMQIKLLAEMVSKLCDLLPEKDALEVIGNYRWEKAGD